MSQANERIKDAYINAPKWRTDLAKELMTKSQKRFTRRAVFSPYIDHVWTSDLADMAKFKNVNKIIL